jgi:hypothetical protein
MHECRQPLCDLSADTFNVQCVAHQPAHSMASATAPLPQGQVAGFRKALWLEHLGVSPTNNLFP